MGGRLDYPSRPCREFALLKGRGAIVGLGGKMRRPGVSRESTGFGGPRHASVVASGSRPGRGSSVLPSSPFRRRPAPPGLVVKVTPDQGLAARPDGHRQRPRPPEVPQGSPRTWFVTECTAAVRGRMNPATDTPHCDISNAQCPPGQSQRLVQLPVPPHDRHHRRRLLRNGRLRHVRHRRRGRPGTGHRRAHHLQDGAAAARHARHHDDHRLTAARVPFRRRAATPGGCSR